MLPWQPFLAFYIWGAHWCHLKNTTEPSMSGGDAALCQITLTTCLTKLPTKLSWLLFMAHGVQQLVGLLLYEPWFVAERTKLS